MCKNDVYTRYIKYLQSLVHPTDTRLEKHRILPQHDGGIYETDNVVRCTFEHHRTAHRLRYEAYGQTGDFIAWKVMDGQTEEARLAMCSFAGKRGGLAVSKLHKEKCTLLFSKKWQSIHCFRGGGQRNLASGWMKELNDLITKYMPEQRIKAGEKGGAARIVKQREQQTQLFDPKRRMQKHGNLARWGVVIRGEHIQYENLSSDFISHSLEFADPKDFKRKKS